METKLIKEEMKKIEMPLKMQERIIKNCRNAGLEEKENVFMAKNISVIEEKQKIRKR